MVTERAALVAYGERAKLFAALVNAPGIGVFIFRREQETPEKFSARHHSAV